MLTRGLFIVLSFFTFWAQAGNDKINKGNGLGILSFVGAGKAPPAALVRFEGQSLDSKAYVLGCGHCNGLPSGDYVYDKYLY